MFSPNDFTLEKTMGGKNEGGDNRALTSVSMRSPVPPKMGSLLQKGSFFFEGGAVAGAAAAVRGADLQGRGSRLWSGRQNLQLTRSFIVVIIIGN